MTASSATGGCGVVAHPAESIAASDANVATSHLRAIMVTSIIGWIMSRYRPARVE
jgi:hypothetical protein